MVVLVIIVPTGGEEFERLLVAEDSGQCERSIPLVVRIRVAHVRALDQTFDEEEVVLWQRGVISALEQANEVMSVRAGTFHCTAKPG